MADLRVGFPGAVTPFLLHKLLATPGDATTRLADFLEKVQQGIDIRLGIVEVLKNDRFVSGEGRSAGWVQANVERELEVPVTLGEVEHLLEELESPLVGAVASADAQGRRLYHFVQDLPGASAGDLTNPELHSHIPHS